MHYQTYMRTYYLKHKEKIKKQSMEWREKNINRVKAIQKSYRTKHQEAIRDFREGKIKAVPFEERVSPETLLKIKENTRINQDRIKYYEWPEDWIPKKRVLEGV